MDALVHHDRIFGVFRLHTRPQQVVYSSRVQPSCSGVNCCARLFELQQLGGLVSVHVLLGSLQHLFGILHVYD